MTFMGSCSTMLFLHSFKNRIKDAVNFGNCGLFGTLTTVFCLPRGMSGLCPPGTEVEDGDRERESEGTWT